MYQKIVYLVLALFLLLPLNLLADKFYYKFEKGEKYRIVSTVDESVYINNRFSYSHLFLNKIAMEVVAVLEGRATIEALFQVSGKMEQSAYELYEEAFSRFTIDSQGNLQVLGNYLYPLSRSIPVFLQQDIKVGFSWTAKGEEIHDLRQPYGIKDPFVIPVNVNYTYNGLKKINNRTLAEFIIQYQFTSRVKLTDLPSGPFYPTSIQGKVQMYYYWDPQIGKPAFYEEEFYIIYVMSTKDVVEFVGKAKAELFFAPALDSQKAVEDINKAAEKNNLDGVRAEETKGGIKIVLENIQFDPDSALITSSEMKKIEFIASILKNYPDRDIKLVGHTAAVGTPESCLELSFKRAEAVARELLRLKARKPEQIIIQGKGLSEPLAPNDTEEGRRKNRRVEIYLLEN